MASRAASATICCRRLVRNGSAPTRSASARRCRKVAKAVSISLGTLALRTSNCRPSARAASSASLNVRADSGIFGFVIMAMTAALGTSSCSSPSALALSKLLNQVIPVTLPPGRLRLAT
jgi:hypothetical protein